MYPNGVYDADGQHHLAILGQILGRLDLRKRLSGIIWDWDHWHSACSMLDEWTQESES